MTRSHLLHISLLLTLLPATTIECIAQDLVKKSFCMTAIGYTGTAETLRKELLTNAKRLAVEELFGELITSFTTVEDFTLTEDVIKASSVGFVRVKGVPIYKNGPNFGEVCATIDAYSTEVDKDKLRPVNISKKNCSSDRNLTTYEIKVHAREQAIISGLIDYERKLDNRSKEELLRLVHKVTYIESGFVPDTETYCVKFQGVIYPIEILALVGNTQPLHNFDIAANKEGEEGYAAVRFVIQGGFNSNRVQLAEIEFYQEDRQIPLFVHSFSSEASGSQWGHENVVDGDPLTYWSSGNQDGAIYPQWFVLKPSNGQRFFITHGQMYTGTHNGLYRLSKYSVYLTEDMNTWEHVFTGRLDQESSGRWELFRIRSTLGGLAH